MLLDMTCHTSYTCRTWVGTYINWYNRIVILSKCFCRYCLGDRLHEHDLYIAIRYKRNELLVKLLKKNSESNVCFMYDNLL